VSHGLVEIRARGSAIELSFIDGSRFLASVRGLPERVESAEVRDDLTFA